MVEFVWGYVASGRRGVHMGIWVSDGAAVCRA